MRQNRPIIKAIITLSILLLISIGLLLIYQKYKPKATEGSKEIVVEVIIPKEDNKEFAIKTDAKYLGQALKDQKLVNGTEDAYGIFITVVDGRAADASKQEWWCITKGEEIVNTGADSTPIADGDHFELTLKNGY